MPIGQVHLKPSKRIYRNIMLTRTLYFVGAFMIAVGLTACGGGEAGSDVAQIEIRPVGDEMRFEQTEFTVKPGQQVRLVFVNTATSPAMQHNVVILTDPNAVDRVGTAAMEAGEANEYVPTDEAILAHTPLAAPGETVEVTFTAPSEPGDYKYICTFPGHYVMMQGTMRVAA